MALSCTLNPVEAYDKESMEDVHTDLPTVATTKLPEVTTILPKVIPENEATAIPETGLKAADGGLSLMAGVAAVAETTLPPVEETTVVPAVPEKPIEYPHIHPHLHTHPYPYPQPYPGFGLNADALPKPGIPGYGFASYPVLRPSYSPYGPPRFHHQYPGYSPGAGYGNPFPDEKPKSDEKVLITETEKKPAEAGLQAADEGLNLMAGLAAVTETTVPTAEGSKVVPALPDKSVSYPFPHPYPGFGYTSDARPKPGTPGYRFPSYPVLRPPYSPYGLPHFHHQYPEYSLEEEEATPETKTDKKLKDPEAEKKPSDISTEGGFGYPTVYASPQYRYLPRYPYANPSSFGYGR